jgi:L-fuculose-phosphate aldolase
MPTDAPLADLIDQLAAAGRHAVATGLVVGSGGNLSARLPGTDTFLVTASGTWLDRLGPDDFVLRDASRPDGVPLDAVAPGPGSGSGSGSGSPGRGPSVEWRLHAHAYRSRPDVGAVVHLHPRDTVLLDALGHRVRLITLDHVLYVGTPGRVPFLPAGSTELAEAVAAQLAGHQCVIMANHGSCTVGAGVPQALRAALNLEHAAGMTLHCLQLGNTDLRFPPSWRDRAVVA